MAIKRTAHSHSYSHHGDILRDVILGGQDGMVNVLGSVLGVAAATNNVPIVIIAGIAATLAESISMGAVAYTSSKASHDFYLSQLALEKDSIKRLKHFETEQIHDLYYKKGFRGKQLTSIVKRITSNKELWLKTIMEEETKLSDTYRDPIKNASVVFFASLIGSLIPLMPFFVMPVKAAIITSFIISTASLFVLGVIKGKVTYGDWRKSGFELASIGIIAAVLSYIIGEVVGKVILDLY
ncbi:VIT1/CCC1 transporter family protein [Candidatus Woesearchaeota archaeon]|nr:VIT1/CCC1 transporter family protein [Candidatus Woesearchaeota archaeon]